MAAAWNPFARYLHWLHTRWPAGAVLNDPQMQASWSWQPRTA